jgi:membrane-bound ClpP family serine protease
VGSAFLLGGGLTLTQAAPQFEPRWWAVVLTVIGIASFYIVALTTVARSRFSTRTIGREHLVGRHGVAETSFDPMGIVEVDGARWQARSHRAAGVGPGDAIEVVAVSGIMLEIAPVEVEPASFRD